MTKNKKPLELNNFSLIRSFSSNRFQDSGEGIVSEKKDDFEKNRFSLFDGINLFSFWILYPQLMAGLKVYGLLNQKPP